MQTVLDNAGEADTAAIGELASLAPADHDARVWSMRHLLYTFAELGRSLTHIKVSEDVQECCDNLRSWIANAAFADVDPTHALACARELANKLSIIPCPSVPESNLIAEEVAPPPKSLDGIFSGVVDGHCCSVLDGGSECMLEHRAFILVPPFKLHQTRWGADGVGGHSAVIGLLILGIA